MKDCDCVEILQWALPCLQMRWPGFRKVRRQVCKRISRRLHALGLTTVDAYRCYLVDHPEEWGVLDSCCNITISRFYRDRRVFDFLGDEVLPGLVQQTYERTDRTVHIWSAGCGAGEEAYSLVLVWDQRIRPTRPSVGLHILATDRDEHSLQRAALACYTKGSLRDLPAAWWHKAFTRHNATWCLRPRYCNPVEFACQDLRKEMPPGPFDLILCRNLVFTYFNPEIQQQVLDGFRQRLSPGGALVIGAHEQLPAAVPELTAWSASHRIYRKIM